MLADQPPITFDDDALAHVVEESQRYPYFLQLWGSALWSAARTARRTRIDHALVAQAAVDFGAQRSAYYEDRREELEREELLPLAASVARLFSARPTLRSDDLNAMIAESTGVDGIGEVLQRRDHLAMVDFVWKPDAEDA